jgi:hypothetical protein
MSAAVFKIIKWAHWLILLDSATYILVIEGLLTLSNFYMKLSNWEFQIVIYEK